jgi:hypothetical protein
MIFMTVIIRFMDDIIGDLMENPVDIIEDPMKILWISVPDSKNRTSDSMTILCAIPVGTFAACSNPTVVTDVCRPFPLRKRYASYEKTYPRNSVCLFCTRPITGYGYYLKINPRLFTEVFPESFSVFYSGIFSVFYSENFLEIFPESSEEILPIKYGKFRREFFQEKVYGIRKVLFLISDGDPITVLPLRDSARLRVCPGGSSARRRGRLFFFGLRLKRKPRQLNAEVFRKLLL